MNVEVTAAIVGAVIGGLAGGMLSFVVNRCEGAYQRCRLHGCLKFYIPENQGNMVAVRVVNDYVLPLQDCWAYITLGYNPQKDILEPDGGREKAFIHPGNPRELKEDRLCWSRVGNPPNLDIYAGEHQALDIVDIEPNGKWIAIPSEKGWEVRRVFLRADRTYKGEIKIVSRDTKHKTFEIIIDPKGGESRVRLLSKSA
jgi:hypothetical protein